MNLNTASVRSRKARAADHISEILWRSILMVLLAFGIGSVALLFSGTTRPFGFIWLGIAVQASVVVFWYKRDLARLPPKADDKSLDDILESKLLARLSRQQSISPKSAWQASSSTWQGRFLENHLLIPVESIDSMLSDKATDMDVVWQKALQLRSQHEATELDGRVCLADYY